MITIHHDRAETVAEGTAKGDGTAPILKANGFRWAPSVSAWTLNRTWHAETREMKARGAWAALIAAGFECELHADTAAPAVQTAEDVAAAEVERAERAAARVERLEARAERTAAESDAAWNKARATADLIPFGQPVLVGHHSEGRHRRDLARIDAGYRKGAELAAEARENARRRVAAEANQSHRMSLGATLRRIDRWEAERRDIVRRMDGTSAAVSGPAEGAYRDRLQVRLIELDAVLEFWRGHVATLEAAGAKVWAPADFKAGDYVLAGGGWCVVVKVNRKTLHLKSRHMVRPLPYEYSNVKAHRTAEQVAAIMAENAEVTA